MRHPTRSTRTDTRFPYTTLFRAGNQFDNIANRKAHVHGTAEEVWAQMEGRVDGFTCAAGTGGTIAGTGLGLKAKDAGVTVALTDPHGDGLYNSYKCGELKPAGSSVAEGIGPNRLNANPEGAHIDHQIGRAASSGQVSGNGLASLLDRNH